MNYINVLLLLTLLFLSSCFNDSNESTKDDLTKEQKAEIIQLETKTILLTTNKVEIDELTEELDSMLEDL